MNKVKRPPQFILLSFDGSNSLNVWKKTRKFAKEAGVRFTYFITGTSFFTYKDRMVYKAPRNKRGAINVKYVGSEEGIRNRIRQLVLAIREGNEIANHSVGHFSGHKWSYSEWLSEFKQFHKVLEDSTRRYKVDPGDSQFIIDYISSSLVGYRAPLLAHNKAMLKVMKRMGYVYDASKINKPDYWPRKILGIWDFPIVKLRLTHSRKHTHSMDYDHYKAHSNAKDIGYYSKKFETDVVDTYLDYFSMNYYGSRAPLHIGHHFSQWNKGVYWEALKKFARMVCRKQEVICGTYSELVRFLESQSQETLHAYRKGYFKKFRHP